jgi:hypothetical protein
VVVAVVVVVQAVLVVVVVVAAMVLWLQRRLMLGALCLHALPVCAQAALWLRFGLKL